MGVNFSHCDVGWAYSGFNRFRDRLTKELGFSLKDMEGFGGNKSWDKIKDPILPLLNHSDCDGNLTPEECKEVAPRLRELVQNWHEDDFDRQAALGLAEGMDAAADAGEKLEFC